MPEIYPEAWSWFKEPDKPAEPALMSVEEMVSAGVQEARRNRQDGGRLSELMANAEVELGHRKAGWGDVTANSLRNAYFSLAKAVPLAAYQTARTAQGVARFGQYLGEGLADRVTPELDLPIPEGAPPAEAPDMALPERTPLLGKRWEKFKKEHPLAIDQANNWTHAYLAKPYQSVVREVDELIANHPEWHNEPPENVKDILTDPKKLYGTVLESVPNLIMAGLLIKTGHPHMAFSLMYASEGQEAFESVARQGGSMEQASNAYHLYGAGAAAIEFLQVNQILKLGEGMYGPLLARTVQKVAKKGGKKPLIELAKVAALEELEEMAQGTWQDVTEAVTYKGFTEPTKENFMSFVDRRAQEAVVAGVLTLGIGLPGASIQTLTGNFQPRSQQEVAENEQAVDEFIASTPDVAPEQVAVPASLGTAHRKIEDTVQALFGKKVAWFVQQDNENTYAGWLVPTRPDTILLNAAMPQPLMKTAFHEMVHAMAVESPESFAQLQQVISTNLRAEPYLAAEIEGMYKQAGLEATPDLISEEIAAEVLGRLAMDPAFRARFMGQPKGLLGRVMGYLNGQQEKAQDWLATKTGKWSPEQLFWVESFIDNIQQLEDQVLPILQRYQKQLKPEEQQRADTYVRSRPIPKRQLGTYKHEKSREQYLKENQVYVRANRLHPDDVELFSTLERIVDRINQMFEFTSTRKVKKGGKGTVKVGQFRELTLAPPKRMWTRRAGQFSHLGNINIEIREKNAPNDRKALGLWKNKPANIIDLLHTLGHEIAHAYEFSHSGRFKNTAPYFIDLVMQLYEKETGRSLEGARKDIAAGKVRPSLVKKSRRTYNKGMPRTTQQRINVATGVTAKATPVATSEERLLKLKMKEARKASREGYAAGAQAIREKLNELRLKVKTANDLRKAFRKYVQEAVPPQYRGRLLGALERIRTETSFKRALERLQEVLDDIQQREERAEFKKLLRRIKKKYGFRTQKGLKEGMRFKLPPDLSRELETILDALSAKRPATEKQAQALEELIKLAEIEEKALREEYGEQDTPYYLNQVKATLENLQKIAAKKSLYDFTYEQLRDLRLSVESIIGEAAWRRSEQHQRERQEWQRLRDEAEGEIKSSHKKPVTVSVEVNTIEDAKKNRFSFMGLFGRYNYNLQVLSDILSGRRKGAFYQVISQAISTGRNKQKAHFFGMMDLFNVLRQEAGITEQDLMMWSKLARTSKVKLPRKFKHWLRQNLPSEADVVRTATYDRGDLIVVRAQMHDGKTVQMTVGEALEILMHSRNRYNYDAMIKSGIALKDTTLKVTAEDIQAIIDQLPPKARQMADVMARMLEVQQGEINEVSQRLIGYALANVENYWHLRRAKPGAFTAKKPEFVEETIESRGYWKERVGGTDPVRIGDAFNTLVDTIDVGAEYIGLAEPMRRARLMMGDNALFEAAKSRGYEGYWKDINKLLQRIQDRRADRIWFDRWYGAWMRNVTRAIFAANIRLSVQQYFSLALTFSEFDFKQLRALRVVPTKDLVSRISSWSPYLRERFMGKIGREVGDVASSGSVMRFLTGHDQIINKSTWLVQLFDKMAICDIWRMVEAEVSVRPEFKGLSPKERPLDRAWREAVTARAEEVVRNTQPTWDVVDRSEIGATRNPYVKGLTMFHSQREKIVQMLGLANSRFANELGDIQRRLGVNKAEALQTPEGRRATARLAKTYGLVFVNTAMLNAWKVLFAALVLKKEDEGLEDWAFNTMAEVPGMYYFVGDVARDVIVAWGRAHQGERIFQLSESSMPAMRVIDSMKEAVYEAGILFQMIIASEHPEDIKNQLRDTWEQLWEALQYTFGLPFYSITQISNAWMQEDE